MNCELFSEMILVGAPRFAINRCKLRTQDSAEKSGIRSKNKERVEQQVYKKIQTFYKLLPSYIFLTYDGPA